MAEKIDIPGKIIGELVLYALSTCIWCRKTRKLLDDLGVAYSVIEVDLIDDVNDKLEIQKEIRKWNPDVSFPTIVVNNKTCITGYDEDKIREVCQ